MKKVVARHCGSRRIRQYLQNKYNWSNDTFESIDWDAHKNAIEKFNVTTRINNNGKFRVIGWVKRGEVQDQGVDQPNRGLPNNAGRVMVEAGTVNHHITRLDPMMPELLNRRTLQQKKFDIHYDFRT